ncbi:hypothetical protein B0H11DRAFT_1910969 [Mycena galericulata]|nr:hypothetical protein B0H11DRAFT_1910969 [Mycena galericulata]
MDQIAVRYHPVDNFAVGAAIQRTTGVAVVWLWWQSYDYLIRTLPSYLQGIVESRRLNGSSATLTSVGSGDDEDKVFWSFAGWKVVGPRRCHIERKGGVDGRRLSANVMHKDILERDVAQSMDRAERILILAIRERSSMCTLHSVGATGEVWSKTLDELEQGYIVDVRPHRRCSARVMTLSGVARRTGVSEQRRLRWLVRRVESKVIVDGPYAATEGSIGLILMLSGIESRACMKSVASLSDYVAC